MSITQEELKSLLHYNHETGIFTWKEYRGGWAYKDSIAGRENTQGYIDIMVKGRRYKAHRLVWLYLYGAWPEKEIDHINGVTRDNRLCNLREATHYENSQNTKHFSNNTSGHKGVSWHKRKKKWEVHIGVNGKLKYIGAYTDIEEAKEAYIKAKAEFHTFNATDRGEQ